MRRRRAPWVLALASLVTLAGCGIPEDSSPRAVVLNTPTPVEAEPTPIPPETTNFTIYLTDDEGRVRPAVREVPAPPTITALIEELLQPPTEEEVEQGLVSRLPPETQLAQTPSAPDNGRAVLDFATGGLDTLEAEELTLAVAQLVWTFTESPSIDQVVIRIEGVDEQWPTDGDDQLVLTRNDYMSFDPDRVAPTPEPVEDEPPVEEPASPTPDDGG